MTVYLVEHQWKLATVGDVFLRGKPAIDRQVTVVHRRGEFTCDRCDGAGRSIVNLIADPDNTERCPDCYGRGYPSEEVARFVSRERAA